MKKNYVFIFVILCTCFFCITGCGNKQEVDKNNKKETTKYTSKDLIVSSNYKKNDEYLNSIFDELDFTGKMSYVSLTEHDDFVTYHFISDEEDTVFTFYFDKNEKIMFLNVIYDRENSNSVSLAKKIIKTKKFDFEVDQLNKINNIITTYSATDKEEIGNYIVSNLSSGNLTIKPKENKKVNVDNPSQGQSTTKPNNSSSNTNTTKSNNNSNSKNTTKPNNNSNNTNTTSNNVPNNNNTENKNQQINKTNNISVNQQNAVNKAKSYLSHSAFSRKGLIEQLEFEKFSYGDSVYGVDHAGANWNQQALKKANSYLSHSAFSRKSLMEQLKFEGFTSDQVNYAINNISVNWNDQAAKKAKSYLSHSSFSRDDLIEQLEFEGFTHDQAVYGVTQAGL